MSKLMIVSSDGHAAPAMADYRPYLESRYHAAFDEFLASEASSMLTEKDFGKFFSPIAAERYHKRLYDTGFIEGRADPARRVEVLAHEGIVGDVIFPDPAPFYGHQFSSGRTVQYEPDVEREGGRAWNRWVVDYCTGYPQLGAQTILSMWDVDEAVKDVYWGAEHGVKGFFLPGMEGDRPLYWDPVYEPLWAAIADVQIPINLHGGSGGPNYRGAKEFENIQMDVAVRVGSAELRFWSQRPLWFMIWSGVFERYPTLRAVFTEQHSDWVSDVIARMDYSYDHPRYKKSALLPLKPSEYFARQVWLGSSLLARGELLDPGSIGADKMMFGADFPHPESTIGMTRDYLRATVGAANMPEESIRGLLGERAAEVFGFDVPMLRALADRHGIALDELREPISPEGEEFLQGTDVYRPTIQLTALA